MAEEHETEPDEGRDDGRHPPRAVVGSHRIEEEMFGRVFDGKIVRRIWAFVRPYRLKLAVAVAAVPLFTGTQLAIPLIIRHAIDTGLGEGAGARSVLNLSMLAFAAVIALNFGASWVQESIVGKTAENVLFDIRTAMFGHLQRVSLSFMDKTEVGRLMSRLQGDVNAMQEFLETSVLSVGDIVLLVGIVREVTQASLGRQIAMVLQEPFLFTGTVLENIRFNKTDASREDVVAAAIAVGAHDFIMALPQGYATMMGERGGSLSLGQRQLVSFARALVADAKILILDEATASIDSYTEMLIQKALVTLLQGRTGLVIAHRLATIRDVDRIIVLANGELIEQGSHDELIKSGGLYSSLYAMSYASFDDIPHAAAAAAAPSGSRSGPATPRQRPPTFST